MLAAGAERVNSQSVAQEMALMGGVVDRSATGTYPYVLLEGRGKQYFEFQKVRSIHAARAARTVLASNHNNGS